MSRSALLLFVPALVGAMPAMPAGGLAMHALQAKSLTPQFGKGERGKADRTPRAVQALAESGAAPTEIAWRTGLPVDAVSMLLSIR